MGADPENCCPKIRVDRSRGAVEKECPPSNPSIAISDELKCLGDLIPDGIGGKGSHDERDDED